MSINKITQKDLNAFKGTLTGYQLTATKSAIYPGQGSNLGLIYCALKLNGEAGELAEHVGKAMRDDGLMKSRMTRERRELIIKEIGDCLWYLSAICNELDITFHAAALQNLEKLFDRTQRDALRGSGDNR